MSEFIFLRVLTPCLLMAGLMFTMPASYAQDEKLPPEQRLNWRGDPETFLDEQARLTLELVENILEHHGPEVNGPNVNESKKRQTALLMIDNVLHEEKAPHREPVQKFFRNRMQQAIEEIAETKVTEGAKIWRLYSHSFVIKTPSVTLGFDLVTVRDIRNRQVPRIDGEVQRGIDGFIIEEDLMQKLVDVTDILFVSHRHLDHADEWVAQRFLEQNKPVLAPPEVWEDQPFYSEVLQLERKVHELQEVHLPEKDLTLGVVNYPGYQVRVQNNVYIVYTPDDMVFSHTGDQNLEESFEWIDRVKDYHKVDVLIPHGGIHIQRMVRGFRPNLVIPGHMNELGHPVTTRYPYWMNYRRLANSPTPWLNMTWGEKYHYLPEK